MTSQVLRIATRKSPLALWQANHVAEKIKQFWPSVVIELVPMTTSGDKFLKDKLLTVGGKGLFVKELEEALLANQADIAVHSMKDVPAFFPDGLSLATICERHNPFDAFIANNYQTLQELPSGSIVGTSSLRRQSQLLALRSDIKIQSLRGNINTRLGKLRAGEFDAIILAVSGLERMELQDSIGEILTEEQMLPACGQGALGIECRADDTTILKLLAPLSDPLSTICVGTERQVNALLGGNCHVPLAVYARVEAEKRIMLRAKILTLDGQTVISDQQEGLLADAETLANNCAKALEAKGAAKLLAQAL
ncbi:Porphobilinogen deaminase [Legionella massiliensis]|uniref:Porphobilinogen deaminase n=1 Tax=Legionella massiliensis TaxID=1034943 RepID=A0A078KY39_9GAMM|nr:hydroxymethylbilane synthase [Legionella massiliensis]CDZ77927.1 Porphobilinogen deaminase [Legionella massiliensis]CEE13665.1 Porphobilinogen deaminase [Legionella massiliensis]